MRQQEVFVMARNKRQSQAQMRGTGFLLIIIGLIWAIIAAYMLFLSIIYGSELTAILLAAIPLLIGVGVLALGLWIRKKAKDAPTAEEISRLEREDAERAKQLLIEPEIKKEGAIFSVKGARGRNLYVFDDKCIINTTAGIGSLITGNATDGEKTIYYNDVIGVQYKQSGVTLGYLQLETASAQMNNLKDNHFNENSFTFDITTVSNERMAEVAEYVKKRVDEYKRNSAQVVRQASSNADELKKYKELLNSGVLTQAEFDEKKKQLLGL